MNELEDNPFRSYRHTASIAGLPLFASALLLMLASVQPTVPGQVAIWIWYALGIAVALPIIWGIGRLALRRQVAKGNPHCGTSVKRRYLLFVFICTVSGVLGVAALAASVLAGWIWLSIGILLPGMLAALALALAASGVLWHLLGKPRKETTGTK